LTHSRPTSQPSTEPDYAFLLRRLNERQDEIEQTILARIYAVSDPTDSCDAEYVASLRDAVREAVAYGFSELSGAEHPHRGLPPSLLAQACRAARAGVSLDTVLRRYLAGYSLLTEFIMQEASADVSFSMKAVFRLAKSRAALFDRLIADVIGAYSQELEGEQHSVDHLRSDRVRRLLAGELLEAAELGYELSAWHLAAVANGPGALSALRALAVSLDRRLLMVRSGENVWAWYGGRRRLKVERVLELAESGFSAETTLAVGEPAGGLSGWRLTHQQAIAALPIAIRGSNRIVRYADVALLSAALRDNVLVRSLRDIYLAPLEEGREGSVVFHETLRAYFDAGCNASSAAAGLGVTRNTVAARLRIIEERIGRTVDGCAAELDTALRLRTLVTR
jgi:hypothetical protein